MANRYLNLWGELQEAIEKQPSLAKYKADELNKWNTMYNMSVWNANNVAYYDAIYDSLIHEVSTDATVIPLVPESSETRDKSD